MIVGIGVDICRVDRLRRLRERYGVRFLDRVFTVAEQAYCGAGASQDLRYAARFAAKEACLKALGTGWAQGLTLRDVEVIKGPAGQPHLQLHRGAAQRATALGVTRPHLSLSHEDAHAVAFVILEQ